MTYINDTLLLVFSNPINGTIEKDYGVDFKVRKDMKLETYLKKEGLSSMSKALKEVKKRIK